LSRRTASLRRSLAPTGRQGFPAALALPVFLPVVYYLIWTLVIGPLNEALGVESKRIEVTDR